MTTKGQVKQSAERRAERKELKSPNSRAKTRYVLLKEKKLTQRSTDKLSMAVVRLTHQVRALEGQLVKIQRVKPLTPAVQEELSVSASALRKPYNWGPSGKPETKPFVFPQIGGKNS
ncbi:hypothetical protein [Deinococcus sedimenti]|uniref:Uncharacterized protein n=1 Tax=Deinococcus sedimenti TaxID=1867090 RepID=A0ABQ2SAF8_9DEIO|nr:hypothetical protein [Deinococcus sedimenti]GGS10882.1 hypothetical protein GCM10008960_41130 [Deinococcus sedimenti]